MKTTNMPGFTAGDSLYKMSGHYRTGRPAITLPTPIISEIYPAREVIEVHSCPPGWTDYGGTCFPDPLTEPSSGGGGGGGMPGGGDGGPGGGGGPPGPMPTPTRPPTKYHPTPFGKCHVRGGTIDKGLYLYDPAKGNWECCREATGGSGLTCVVCEENGVKNPCRDGHL